MRWNELSCMNALRSCVLYCVAACGSGLDGSVLCNAAAYCGGWHCAVLQCCAACFVGVLHNNTMPHTTPR
eukprot:7715685-Lingulodinium_polyedra.AAC.1